MQHNRACHWAVDVEAAITGDFWGAAVKSVQSVAVPESRQFVSLRGSLKMNANEEMSSTLIYSFSQAEMLLCLVALPKI